MTYGLRSMTAAMLCALLAGPIATASAMPIGNGLVAKNAIPTDVESVRWRGGWGGRGWGGRGWGWGWGVPAGIAAGAIIGGALAAPYYYGYDPYYPAYYGYPPYGPGPYAAPAPGEAVAYCMQRFRSYDPRSGTYLGYDGLRHPCP